MIRTVKYHINQYSLSASCIKQRAVCPLAKIMTAAVNLRVMCNADSNTGRFECILFIHNKAECGTQKDKEQLLDVMKQICQQCQQQTPKQR